MAKTIDLDLLPPPNVVETLSYEEHLDAITVDFKARFPNAEFLESDPAQKLLELVAYLSLTLRQRVNDAARQVMLAYATGTNLEHLGALFGVLRLVLDSGDPGAVPPVPPTYETDKAYRVRIQSALEGFSTAGPRGAYDFHAKSVAGVKDVGIDSPVPGDVRISVLSIDGDGTPAQDLKNQVKAVLNDEDIRPLTDNVLVISPTIKNYKIKAVIYTFNGPDPKEVIDVTVREAIKKLVIENHKLGRDNVRSAIIAACHVAGVQRVELSEPASDIINTEHETGFCDSETGITLIHGGQDE